MINIDALWDDVKSKLAGKLVVVSYEVWIQKLVPVCFVKNKLVLLANSKSAKNTIDQKYLGTIASAVNEVNPTIENVIIITENQKEEYLKQQDYIVNEEFVVNEPKKQQTGSNNFNRKFTFDNFVIGKSNSVACAAAQAVAECPGSKYNPLFIYGGVGLGKTHIMHAIGNYIQQHSPQLKILYTTAEKFTNEFIGCLRSTDRAANIEFREKYRSVDVIMFDDVQFLQRKDAVQEELFHTFNDLYQNEKQIILSSDRHPNEIPTLADRLKTRFLWGLPVDIQTPDLETRVAILETKASQQNCFLPPDIATFIAENITTNIREMESALNKVLFFSQLTGSSNITLDMAEEALSDLFKLKHDTIDENDIINKTCQYFNVSKADIIGKKRTKEIVEARMIAIYIIRDMLSVPLQSIGTMFGNRDHTTIINARDKIAEQIKENGKTKIQVEDIKALLNNR